MNFKCLHRLILELLLSHTWMYSSNLPLSVKSYTVKTKYADISRYPLFPPC